MSCPLGYGRPASAPKKFSVLGFETEIDNSRPFTNQNSDDCNYTDYIQTEKLLTLQDGESIMKPDNKGMMHHEELLFIVTHQSIELWFKVLLKDLEKTRELLLKSYTTDLPEPGNKFGAWKDLALVGHYLRRATMIFHHASGTFGVLQTMHPADFLEFRDYLVPASGFQSFQFRQIEILMGVDESKRVECNGSHVFNALQPDQKEQCEGLITEGRSIRNIVENLLLSVDLPSNFMEKYYEGMEELQLLRQQGPAHHTEEKAKEMAKEKTDEIREMIEKPDQAPGSTPEAQQRMSDCIKSALYVSSYRTEHPQFAVLSETLDELVALEEGILLFRGRHVHNVERIIGRRIGTGGSSGVEYLEKTREYRIFDFLWALRSIFIRASILPPFSFFHPNADSACVLKQKSE